MYTALKAKVPFLNCNEEREFGYAGYEGMSRLRGSSLWRSRARSGKRRSGRHPENL